MNPKTKQEKRKEIKTNTINVKTTNLNGINNYIKCNDKHSNFKTKDKMQELSVLYLKKFTFIMRHRKTGGSRLEKVTPWKQLVKGQ